MLKFEFGGLHTVISGGQTGADQGGLMGARDQRVYTAGTAPAFYRTSDGVNPLLELLNLKARGDYRSRTISNIRASDGTLILAFDAQSPGTKLTIEQCELLKKPYLLIDLILTGLENPISVDTSYNLARIAAEFVLKNQIQVLNVAGNRDARGETRVFDTSRRIVSTMLALLDDQKKLIKES